MRTQFYILLCQKTSVGYTTFGQYWLGFDREVATGIFSKLQGKENDQDRSLLHLDFMECIDEIPIKIKTISCTLDEYVCNSKIIAKELFCAINLEGKNPG